MILLELLKSAVKPTLKTALWLLKIMLPVTLVVSILDYYGWIEQFSQFSTPLFSLIGLEGEAAIPFITWLFASLYAAIAVMASLSLDFRTVTILTTMCLISHNLIVECKIQQKAGSPIAFTATLRILCSLLSGYVLNLVLPADYAVTLLMPMAQESYSSLVDLIKGWLASSTGITVKILVIVYLLNIVQNTLRRFNLIERMKRPVAPIMAVLGLPKSTSILWIIANTLGLAYGGVAIVEELEQREISLEDARLMNSSTAITHSLMEDSFVFLAIGVGLFWITIPRIIVSILVVFLQRQSRKIAKGRLKFL